MAKKKESPGASDQLLKRQLKAGTLGSFYVFCGEEDYLRRYYLEKLRQTLVGGFAQDFNHHIFEGKTLEMSQLGAALEALPVMSDRTLVEVRDFEMFKAREEVREQLTALVSDLPAWTCLIFVYEHLDYAPDGRMKKLAAAMDKAQVIRFAKQNERELSDWVRRRFQALGKDIEIDLCGYLCFQTGGSMSSLIPEIEKTAAHCQTDKISRLDIDAVVVPVLDASTFEMARLVGERRFGPAMEKLNDLYSLQNDPVPILWSLGRQCRQMYAARVLLESGRGTAGLSKLCGGSDYAARQISASAARFSTDWCAQAVRLCCLTDQRLKTSYGDAKRQVELLLLRLAGEAKQ